MLASAFPTERLNLEVLVMDNVKRVPVLDIHVMSDEEWNKLTKKNKAEVQTMSDVMTVENTEMQIREYNGQRVVTFKDIDRVHERVSGTARRAFSKNRKRFLEGTDYFMLKPSGNPNVQNTYIRNLSIPNKGITVLTETGYLMIVKTFTDDLSWSVQRQLVNNYFEKRVVQNVVDEAPKIDKDKEQLIDRLMIDTSNRPRVPLIENWYQRNIGRIERICKIVNIPKKVLYHLLLKRLGEKYDLDVAKGIYTETVGVEPKYAMEIVSFFPELGEMADGLLDRIEKNIYY